LFLKRVGCLPGVLTNIGRELSLEHVLHVLLVEQSDLLDVVGPAIAAAILWLAATRLAAESHKCLQHVDLGLLRATKLDLEDFLVHFSPSFLKFIESLFVKHLEHSLLGLVIKLVANIFAVLNDAFVQLVAQDSPNLSEYEQVHVFRQLRRDLV